MGRGDPAFPGPKSPGKRCRFRLLDLPRKFFPHVRAESSCSFHWRPPGEWVCVVREEPQQAGGKVRAPEPGEGAPCTLLVASGQAPACYCLKPRSPVPMGQKGSRRILLGR